MASSDPDFQVLIYDDHSDTGHLKCIHHILELDRRVSVVYGTENKGCGYGYNLLSANADSEIIHYVGADDLIHPHRIREAAEFHCNFPSHDNLPETVNILSTNVRYLDHNYTLLPSSPSERMSDGFIRAAMYFYTPIVHGTISIGRKNYDKLIPFDMNKRAGVDYLFFCQNNSKVRHIKHDCSRYYIRLKEGSLTRSQSSRRQQLKTHDEAMLHLWKQHIASITIDQVTFIRRLLITSDHLTGDLTVSRSALNKAIYNIEQLIEGLATYSVEPLVANHFLNVLKTYASQCSLIA